MNGLKLGSLFDGSGGFPLAGVLHGIEPVWASEIEPYPIRVTKARFPNMKHLGDVTKINGAEIEKVDIITFGSPCQDLSVAGKQLGIHEGERSNLFFEAIRIIKEMREDDKRTERADQFLRPRFAVWENVPGAFSSNKGEDFRAVLQAFCGVAGEDFPVPMPPKGKWNPAGCVVGDGWSVAWRVYDAQFWGVPQRRKRIYLIADFGSERAGEILFEREGVRGNPAAGGKAGQGAAADAKGSTGGSDRVGVVYPINMMVATRGGRDDMRTCFGIGAPNDTQFTLQAAHEHGVCYAIEGNGTRESHQRNGYAETDKMYTLNATEQHKVAYALEGNTVDRDSKKNGKGFCEDVSPTLNTQDRHAICFEPGQSKREGNDNRFLEDIAPTIRATMGDNKPAVCYPDKARSLTARHDSSPCVDRGQNVVAYAMNSKQISMMVTKDKSNIIASDDYKEPQVVCYKPSANFCGTYQETDTSATLETKYHFGGGRRRRADGI